MSEAATGAARAPTVSGRSLAGSKLPELVAKFISVIGDKKMMAESLEEVSVYVYTDMLLGPNCGCERLARWKLSSETRR
jgi:hypothetical protein